MPYEYRKNTAAETHLHLWPHRSLGPQGFVWFIGGTAALIALPLLGLLGTPALWGLLPFVAAALGGIWWALRRNSRDRAIVETLTLTRTEIRLSQQSPDGRRSDWQANPHWVTVTLHPTGGPVPNYLTLRGNNREVELGAFLAEEERIALAPDLRARLAALR